MKNIWKTLGRTVCVLFLLTLVLTAIPATAYAADNAPTAAEQAEDSIGAKAIAAAIVVGLAAAGGTVAMGMAISRSADGVSRQPEAENKIRTLLMLGLVFIETVVIYALIVAILIIFVL